MTKVPNRIIRYRSDGFSFLEILVAVVFLMAGIFFLFSVFSSSNKGTLDAYKETIAYSIAHEGLEWVAGIGYENLLEISKIPGNSLEKRFNLGNWQLLDKIKLDDGSMIDYPDDYKQFERLIELEHFPALRVMRVKVTVQPHVGTIIRRGSVVLERIVGAEYD